VINLTKRLSAAACLLACFFVIGSAQAEVVVVVSADSTVDSLSRAELTDIYLGRLNRFPDGSTAVPIDQSERSSAHDEFYSKYLGRTPAQIKAHWSRLIFTGRGQPPRSVRNGDAVLDAIADNPNAIGYVDSQLVDDRLRVVRVE
jgi:ABC-type phosphate transport system substrate-binding protein